jgi:hypothetical protein
MPAAHSLIYYAREIGNCNLGGSEPRAGKKVGSEVRMTDFRIVRMDE